VKSYILKTHFKHILHGLLIFHNNNEKCDATAGNLNKWFAVSLKVPKFDGESSAGNGFAVSNYCQKALKKRTRSIWFATKLCCWSVCNRSASRTNLSMKHISHCISTRYTMAFLFPSGNKHAVSFCCKKKVQKSNITH
jgi:hypothetical protein